MIINDGIQSFATSLGQKIGSLTYKSSQKLSDNLLVELYRDCWIMSKFVDRPCDDMTRLDRVIDSSMTKSQLDDFWKAHKQFKTHSAVNKAAKLSRLMGQSAVIAITNADDFSAPRTTDEKLSRFVVVECGKYTLSDDKVDNILSEDFLKPMYVEIGNDDKKVRFHHSRFHLLTPLSIPSVGNSKASFYSEVQRIYEPLMQFLSTLTVVSELVHRANIPIYKDPDFNTAMASGNEANYKEALIALKSIQDVTGVTLIGDTSSFETLEVTFTGLPDVLKTQFDVLSGACDIPLTILFGQSATGFSSGEEDNQIYYDRINAMQEHRLRDLWAFIDSHIKNVIDFSGEIDFTFPVIRKVTESEDITNGAALTSMLSMALADGVIDFVQYAKELKERGYIRNITDEDIKELMNSDGDDEYAEEQ